MAVYSTIAIPPDMKQELLDRAGPRPIFRMLQEEFLHEPDTDKLIELKFKALEQHFDDKFEQLRAESEKLFKLIFATLKQVTKKLDEHDFLLDRHAIETKHLLDLHNSGVKMDIYDFMASVRLNQEEFNRKSNAQVEKMAADANERIQDIKERLQREKKDGSK